MHTSASNIFIYFLHFSTPKGTKEIVCGVDEETGDVFLSFEACEISEHSKFIWSKSYKEIAESKRVTASAVGRTCVVLPYTVDADHIITILNIQVFKGFWH